MAIKKFFKTETVSNKTLDIEGLIPRKDIAFIPHIYDIRWSTDINNLLSEMFFCPVEWVDSSYLPGRSEEHLFLSKMFPHMRLNQIKKCFFNNVTEDYTQDIMKAGFAKELYGIVHGTHFSSHEYGGNKKLQSVEVGIVQSFKKIFVACDLMKNMLPYETIAVGIPIFETVIPPKGNDLILFNHRLCKDKNPFKLFELPDNIKKRIHVTCPKSTLQYITPMKVEFGDNFHLHTPLEEYRQLIDQSGFGISFADNDNFGLAVTESIMKGLFYLCPNNDTTSYRYIIHKDMLYNDMDELIYKIEYYTEHKTERKRIIKEAQKMLEPYYYKNWYNTIIQHID